MDPKMYCVAVMEASLRQALDFYKVNTKEPYTHTTKSPTGSYYISSDAIDSFFTIYCNAIIKGVRPTILEKPGAYGPVRADFDMKASLDLGVKRQYTDEIINKIVSYYQEEMKAAIVEESFDPKMLWCLVLEKKAPRSDEGTIKDGFHLHFPHFICEPWFQDEYLRTRVTDKMVSNRIWSSAKYE
jgi:hypothetical protein